MSGYYSYLKDKLRPLGLYNLDEGFGAEELRLVGNRLDGALEKLEELEKEGSLATASDYGISRWEEVLPYKPASPSVEDKRGASFCLLISILIPLIGVVVAPNIYHHLSRKIRASLRPVPLP
ncbi:hypothetical protein LJC01_02220 [Clostridiaceae bacterium OttesenSCG-928-D20]|nr:hypothetical protein [Clostridiaceae bacterium OttesenSCG-928-D20]